MITGFYFGLTILLNGECCLCKMCCNDMIKLFSLPAPLISMESTSRRIWVPSSSPQSWWWIQSKEKCSKLQEEICKSMRFCYYTMSTIHLSCTMQLTDWNSAISNQWSCICTVDRLCFHMQCRHCTAACCISYLWCIDDLFVWTGSICLME